ncbi:MAG: serine hydrolase domain-containing protein [Acidimicrobiia bacterium]
MPAVPDFSPVVALLEEQRAAGWHPGAQIYVSRNRVPLLDTAIGESAPGRALDPDDYLLWYSSGKPVTTAAIMQLVERGQLDLDTPVAAFIPGWGNGKEACTVRHVLVHTGGFTMVGHELFDTDVSYAEAIDRIAAHPAEWEPGTAAGYHPTSGWKVLGAIVEAIDGRPITEYVREEIATPLGVDIRIAIPEAEQRELGARLVPVHWCGYHVFAPRDGMMQMLPYHADRYHNAPWHIAKPDPGGSTRGSARALGRFYESLLGYGPAILEPTTVATIRTTHRSGLKDRSLPVTQPWGLGVQIVFTGGTSRAVFGHNGMGSSRGFADAETGLVCVLITNGLAGVLENEQRCFAITNAVYSAFGEELAAVRRTARPVSMRDLLG